MDRTEALDQIAAVVGEAGLVRGSDADALLRDERGLYRGAAALVVRPASTDECAQVLRLCQSAGLGVVPQGGNTGYCGGATAFDAGAQIVLNLARMNRIREVDSTNFTMTVDAGVILATAQNAAREHGLLFPLSMGSEGSCHIGGTLATNAGGISVIQYGNAGDLVLGLEVVLADGQVLSDLKGLRKDNAGYDLNAIFLGSEGTLGLITAAVLKLVPEPSSRETAWLAAPSVQAVCDVLRRARTMSGDRVVSAEYISRSSLELVLAHIDDTRDPLDSAHEHYMLLELADVDAGSKLREVIEDLFQTGVAAGEIADGVLAESEQQREAIWRLRESIPEAERRSGGSVKHDISVRISSIPEFLERAQPTISAVAPHRLSVFGHVGDGNLHYNLLPPVGTTLEAFSSNAPSLSEAVHDLAIELDGSFSAEHGIGVLKRPELERYASPGALRVMRALKGALDPAGTMNPGKVIG